MGFLAPWFLAGAVALGLPVWLHMLQKHKTTPLPFSSLMFFEKAHPEFDQASPSALFAAVHPA